MLIQHFAACLAVLGSLNSNTTQTMCKTLEYFTLVMTIQAKHSVTKSQIPSQIPKLSAILGPPFWARQFEFGILIGFQKVLKINRNIKSYEEKKCNEFG